MRWFLLVLWAWSTLAWAEGKYVVRQGDTLQSIATQLGAPRDASRIAQHNNLSLQEPLSPGAVLTLPNGMWSRGGCQPAYAHLVRGQATVLPQGGGQVAIELREGAILNEGDTICTQGNSHVTLRLAMKLDASRWDDVVLLEDSCAVLDSTTAIGERRASFVTLRKGAIQVPKARHEAGEIAIATSAGVAVGGGGGFRVRRVDTTTLTEAVYTQVVTLAKGAQVDVPAGFGNLTEDGEAPGGAVQLLEPGEPLAPAAEVPLTLPRFQWTPVPRTVGYFLTIARDQDFAEIVYRDYIDDGAELTMTELVLPATRGGLWWQVTSMSRNGLEGMPSSARRFYFPFGVTASGRAGRDEVGAP